VSLVTEPPEAIPLEAAQVVVRALGTLGFQQRQGSSGLCSFKGLVNQVDLGSIQTTTGSEFLLSSDLLLRNSLFTLLVCLFAFGLGSLPTVFCLDEGRRCLLKRHGAHHGCHQQQQRCAGIMRRDQQQW
jgi:hypothetical protein